MPAKTTMESESCSEIVQQLIARLPWAHNLSCLTPESPSAESTTAARMLGPEGATIGATSSDFTFVRFKNIDRLSSPCTQGQCSGRLTAIPDIEILSDHGMLARRPHAMKHNPLSRFNRKKAKTVLRLPDLEFAKTAVLSSLTSLDAQRGYRHAIDEFVD
jgi:hypothetical protein